MYCDLRESGQNVGVPGLGGPKGVERQEREGAKAWPEETELGGRPREDDPYADQKNLEMLPDVGFFKKLK